MNKGLEALKSVKDLVNNVQYASKIPCVNDELSIIEKGLQENEKTDKALNIIRRNPPLVCSAIASFTEWKYYKKAHEQGNYEFEMFIYNKSEFDLVKEVLCK